MKRLWIQFTVFWLAVLVAGCQQLGLPENDAENQEKADLGLLAAAALALQTSDSSRDLSCSVTATAGPSNVTSTETLILPSTSAFNIFKGDDARASSAVYVVFDSASAGQSWLVKNFGSYPANQGEGTIAAYTGNNCPLDTTSGGGRSAGSAVTISGGTGDRTITFNTAGAYIVQFYTGTGVGTGNGANATLQLSN